MPKLSENKLKEISEVFAHFDKDGNGTICTEELSKVMRSLGQKPSAEDIQDVMASADRDGTGTISLEEFIKAFQASFVSHMPPEKEVKDAFKKFDQDGSGHITAAELRTALSQITGDSLSDVEALEIVQEADSDGDNLIDYNEFVRMMFAS